MKRCVSSCPCIFNLPVWRSRDRTVIGRTNQTAKLVFHLWRCSNMGNDPFLNISIRGRTKEINHPPNISVFVCNTAHVLFCPHAHPARPACRPAMPGCQPSALHKPVPTYEEITIGVRLDDINTIRQSRTHEQKQNRQPKRT